VRSILTLLLLRTVTELFTYNANISTGQLRRSSGSVLPLSTQVRGLKPSRSRQEFSGRKDPQHAFLRRGSKTVGPVSQFAARKRSLNWRGSRNFRQNYRPFLTHTVPPFATRISNVIVDMGVPGGKHGNIQTGGGDRVSTRSLLGCSTSVALATGSTDEEAEHMHNWYRPT